MIVAPSDQPRIVEMILNAHPEKRRLILVHVPKCAGTDLTANLGTRYPVVHQTLANSNWTPPERLQASWTKLSNDYSRLMISLWPGTTGCNGCSITGLTDRARIACLRWGASQQRSSCLL